MQNRVPEEELPILEAIINIRNRLQALKKDRQNYIKSSTVTEIYDEVIIEFYGPNSIKTS